MAALNEAGFTDDAIKALVAAAFWGWFDKNQDRVVTHVHVWFISHTVKVSDLREVFTLLFGDRPAQSPATPASA